MKRSPRQHSKHGQAREGTDGGVMVSHNGSQTLEDDHLRRNDGLTYGAVGYPISKFAGLNNDYITADAESHHAAHQPMLQSIYSNN